jgi:hypothetical protein
VIHIQAFIALGFLTGILLWAGSDRVKVRQWRNDLDQNPYPETWKEEEQ